MISNLKSPLIELHDVFAVSHSMTLEMEKRGLGMVMWKNTHKYYGFTAVLDPLFFTFKHISLSFPVTILCRLDLVKMLPAILTLALLSTTASEGAHQRRTITDAAGFTSAADELISTYLPSSVVPVLSSLVSSAANAAQITGDPISLAYSALAAPNIPAWFSSAIPEEWEEQFSALESIIANFRPNFEGLNPGVSPTTVVIVITTTDSDGNAITTSRTPSVSIASAT
jgi:hypothetical protein